MSTDLQHFIANPEARRIIDAALAVDYVTNKTIRTCFEDLCEATDSDSRLRDLVFVHRIEDVDDLTYLAQKCGTEQLRACWAAFLTLLNDRRTSEAETDAK